MENGSAAIMGMGSVTTTSAADASGIAYIDNLLYGRKWNGTSLSIAFPTTAASVGYAVDGSYFTALSSPEQTAFKAILARWAAVSGLSFTEVADPTQADISIYWYRSPDNVTARTVAFPDGSLQAGDIQLGSAINGGDLSTTGSYSFFTALHEVGHALGLKHPSETINGFPGSTDVSVETSVMSYISYMGGPISGGYSINNGSYPSAPMLADIATIQYLYGVNANALTANIGDTTYTFDPTANVIFQTRWDGGGFDTFNFSSYTTNLSIDLRPGHWSDLGGQYAVLDSSNINVKPLGNIAVSYLHDNNSAYLIEAAYGGSGNDLLIGNQADNLLRGVAGNDTLKGMGGTDTLAGGSGNDTFDLTDSTSGAVQISDFTNDDTIILPVSPGSISQGDGSALTAGQVSMGFTGVYNVLFVGLDSTPGYDLRIMLANSTGYDNLSLSGAVFSRINDTRAPDLVAVSAPADNATKVSLAATPTLTFHEQVLPGTGNFIIYNVTDGTIFKTIAANSLDISGWNTPSIRINPNYGGNTPLLGGKEYAILWDATAVKDLTGNSAPANSDVTLYNFTSNSRPTATAHTSDIGAANAGETSYSFTVTYADSDGSIDASSIDSGNVTVTAPDNSSLTVTAATWDAASRTATYTVAVPGSNGWNAATSGSYSIALVAGSVKDDTGDGVAAVSNLAGFSVDLVAPAAPHWQLASDTGRLNNDQITSNGTLNVTGLESGASWAYSVDNGQNWRSGSGSSFTLDEGRYEFGHILVRQTDAAGNISVQGTSSGAVTVDMTAPALVSIQRVTPSSDYTNADSLTFRVTFNEEVYGLAGNIAINGTSATLSSSTRNGLSYDFSFTGGDLAALNGAVSISFVGSGFADAAGNALVATPTGANESYIVDNTAPLFVSGTAAGGAVTLTFGENVQRGNAGSFTFYNMTDGQVVETIAYDAAAITGWGSTALVLTPTDALPAGKQISVRWTGAAAIDRAGNALAGNSGDTLFNFNSNQRPTLGQVTAADLGQAAAGNGSHSFAVRFTDSDGSIDASSIGTGNVTVTGPGGVLTVTGAIWDATTGTATYSIAAPGSIWDDADNGSYSIALLAGQVKDNQGAAVAANSHVGSFSVAMDTTPPLAPTLTLSSDSGQSNSDGISNLGGVTVAGLENGATWEYSLNGGTDWATGSGTSFTLGAGSYSAGMVQVRQIDLVGLTGPAAALAAVTIDQQAPTLSSGAPGNGTTGVALNAAPVLTFAEPVYQGTGGSFTLYNVTDGTVLETLAVTDTAITGWGSSSLTFRPGADLPVGKQIAIRWQAGTLNDLAGNAVAANVDNTAYHFTTITPPTTNGLVAADLDQVAAGAGSYSFSIRFSDSDGSINASSIDINDVTVTGPGGALVVTGALWDATTGTATYTITAPGGTWDEADNGTYTIALAAGQVTDETGLAVAANASLGGFSVTIDSTPPAAPTLTLAADTGISASDRITRDGTITVGGLEDAGGWEYSLDGGNQWTSGIGTSLTLAAGTYADNLVQVRQKDAAGLTGPVTGLAAITVDGTAPSITGISRSGPAREVTNADTLIFRVSFSEAVQHLDTSDLTVQGSAALVQSIDYTGVGNSYDVTVSGGDLAGLNGIVRLALANGHDVTDSAGNRLTDNPTGTVETYRLDNQAPSLSTAMVNGNSLSLLFSEPIVNPSAAGFRLTVNGINRAITASSGEGDRLVLTLALPVFNGDVVSLSYDGAAGQLADAVGNAATATTLSVSNQTALPPVREQDGVSIIVTPGLDGEGRLTESLRIDPIAPRPDGSPFATLSLAGGAGNVPLTAAVPVGVGLTVSGTVDPLAPDATGRSITGQLDGLNSDANIGGMFSQAAAGAPITLRSITLSGSSSGGQPISITGSAGGSNGQSAVLLDTRTLPGAMLMLDNLHYVVLVGDATVGGGAGATFAVGDAGRQSMILGADNDTLRGGGGDDTIGSAGGDDLLYGDAGNDSVFGGIGNDSLSGGTGHDTLDGGEGIDVVRVDARFAEVTITRLADGSLSLTHASQGSDIIRNVEILRFDDRVMLVNMPDRPMESLRGLSFDTDFYLSHYPDVDFVIASGAVVSAEQHYALYGAAEGRRPNALFNELWYRAQNPDVDAAIKAGLISTSFAHYQTYGWQEGRNPSGVLDMAAVNPDRLGFDAAFYRAQNPDVAAAVDAGRLSSALEHYLRYGQQEGRDPNALFDESWYLSTYADARQAVADGTYTTGYQHYLAAGWKQGHDPSHWLDTSRYLADNPDVAAADIDPLSHYLNWGLREGRSIMAADDGVWLV